VGRFVRLDWAIARLLRDKTGFEILEGLLSELFRYQVTVVEILGNKNEEGRARYNRVDLMLFFLTNERHWE